MNISMLDCHVRYVRLFQDVPIRVFPSRFSVASSRKKRPIEENSDDPDHDHDSGCVKTLRKRSYGYGSKLGTPIIRWLILNIYSYLWSPKPLILSHTHNLGGKSEYPPVMTNSSLLHLSPLKSPWSFSMNSMVDLSSSLCWSLPEGNYPLTIHE